MTVFGGLWSAASGDRITFREGAIQVRICFRIDRLYNHAPWHAAQAATGWPGHDREGAAIDADTGGNRVWQM